MTLLMIDERERTAPYAYVVSGDAVRDITGLLDEEPGPAGTNSVTMAIKPAPRRSLMELRGLGREIWKGVDAQAYVNELRDDWSAP